jgi:hypothetical protein
MGVILNKAAVSLRSEAFAGGSDSAALSRIDKSNRYRWTLFVLFAIELLLFAYLQRATLLSFDYYYFQDQGTNLVAQYLTNSGLRSAVDFGYNWGLLGLLFGRLWFALFGATPIACEAGLFVTAGLGVACALARISARLDLDAPAMAIVVLTLPFAARFMPPSFSHGLEAALIANAIACQLEGRKSVALALATAALFARPAIGFFYCAWLIFLMVRDCYRDGRFSIDDTLTSLAPAAVTGLGLALLLCATYGPQSLMHTLIPTHGVANYRASHYGFFNQGAAFLYSRKAGWIWYLGTAAGIWIAASLWLVVRGVQSLPALVAGRATPRQELTVTCALLHGVFVLLMFGNTWTWTYYFFILIIGTVAAFDGRSATRLGCICLHGMVALSLLFFLSYVRQLDPGYVRDSKTGLWWSADQSDEWAHVLKLIDGKRSALMVEAGGGALLSPAFQKPVAMYLLPEYQAGGEPDREARQLRDSDAIVTTVQHPTYLGSCLNYYPKLREAMGNARITFRGKYYVVYEQPSGYPR